MRGSLQGKYRTKAKLKLALATGESEPPAATILPSAWMVTALARSGLVLLTSVVFSISVSTRLLVPKPVIETPLMSYLTRAKLVLFTPRGASDQPAATILPSAWMAMA